MADKKEGGIFKIALNLILTCLVSGCIIGAVYFVTGPIATAKAAEMKEQSMKELVPQADKFVPVEGKKDTYIAEKGGQKVAFMGRKIIQDGSGKRRIIVFRVSESDYTRLKTIANKYRSSVSNTARQLLGISMEKLE